MTFKKKIHSGLVVLTTLTAIGSISADRASAQQPQKRNILVIMADDIGYWYQRL
jgi:hypothetical protein